MSRFSTIMPFVSKNEQTITELTWERYDTERTEGTPILEPAQPIAELRRAKGVLNDVLISPLPELIVSERLKDFLVKTRDCQYFQFVPVAFKGRTSPTYFVLHCLGLVDAFDWEKSKYELFVPDAKGPERTIRRLHLMVIDQAKVGNRQLFTMPDWTAYQFIDRAFGEQLIAEGFTGIRLLPLRGEPG